MRGTARDELQFLVNKSNKGQDGETHGLGIGGHSWEENLARDRCKWGGICTLELMKE